MIRHRRGGGAAASPPREEIVRWPMPDGGFLIEEREVVLRRWWNRLTQPIGIALIVGGGRMAGRRALPWLAPPCARLRDRRSV